MLRTLNVYGAARACLWHANGGAKTAFSAIFSVRHAANSTDVQGTEGTLTPASVAAVDAASLKRQTPTVLHRESSYPNVYRRAREAWLETLRVQENIKLGMVDLHPDVFGTFPRLDIIHKNLQWQSKYRVVDYTCVPMKHELTMWSNRKPWPQKGTGHARQGTRKGLIWGRGAWHHGPRGPQSYFYMLPEAVRVMGLRSALSVKYAQDDLHIVDSLDLPSDDPTYLENVIESRNWGISVLFVDATDVMPRNLAVATSHFKHYTMMPVYGLNVFSILKHDTLVLTRAAVDELEKRLLERMNTCDRFDKKVTQLLS